jgi:hypothetical protein
MGEGRQGDAAKDGSGGRKYTGRHPKEETPTFVGDSGEENRANADENAVTGVGRGVQAGDHHGPTVGRDGKHGVTSNVSDELQRFIAAAAAQLPGWPPHVIHYLEVVMIARGGAKALSIRSETVGYLDHLSCTADAFTATAAALRANTRRVEDVLVNDIGAGGGRLVAKEACSVKAVAALQEAGRSDKFLNLLDGCGPVTHNLVRWLRNIVEDPTQRFFVAGDGGAGEATDFVPEGFEVGALIAGFKPAAAKWGPAMREVLVDTVHDWPPTGRLMYMEGHQRCRHCKGAFSNLWVSNGACFRCEGEMRASGRCPVGSKCPANAFCPHEQRCIACERWSCDICGVVCGDGEDVAAIVEATAAAAVFLDFDRTLSTTKSGGSPLTGRHTMDPELFGLACSHPNVHVVTRNSHSADIAAFLSRAGVPLTVQVHHVGKGNSKAEVIRNVLVNRMLGDSGADITHVSAALASNRIDLGSGSRADVGTGGAYASVLVDDSIAELLDADVAAVPNLTRVLFSRVLA